MKNILKITQYILLILTLLITLLGVFLNSDLGLIIRGILLALFWVSMILEDKLETQAKISGTTFVLFRTIVIIIVFLIDFKF